MKDKMLIEKMMPEGSLQELILVSISQAGKTNLAPIGVWSDDKGLLARIGRETQSMRNLLSRPQARFCVTLNPLLIAKSAFNLDCHEFILDDSRGLPQISGSEADILVEMKSHRDFVKRDLLGNSPFVEVLFEVKEVKVKGLPRPPSRSLCATIDSIIGITRARLALERELEIYEQLARQVRENISKARRLGTNQEEEEALQLCEEELKDMTREE